MMFLQRASPGLITYNAAIGSCKRGGRWEIAFLLWQNMCAARSAWCDVSLFSYPSFVDQIFDCFFSFFGYIEICKSAISEVRALLPDVITYNCAIGTCNVAGKWSLALHLFSSMPSPDSSTFTELAGALEKAKEWTKSLQILSVALSRHLVPDGTFAGSIAGAVGAARGKDLAMSLLREMLERWKEGKEGNEGNEGKERKEGKEAGEIGMEPAMKSCNAPLLQRSGVDILKMQPGVLVLMKPSGLSTETMMELAFGELWSKSVQTVSRQEPLHLIPHGI